jgi:predicted MFS family arabinose efflux permease
MRFSLSTQIVAVIFMRLLLNTGRRFIYPFAPAISRFLAVPLSAVTPIIAVSQVSSLLGLFSGVAADRLGTRYVMRVGLALLAIGMLCCGLVPAYWPLFCGLVVASFGKTVFDPAIQAFIGRHVEFSRRGRIIGLVETAWAGSTLFGIPALGLIIDALGLRVAFFLFAVLGALAWLSLGLVFPHDTRGSAESYQQRPMWGDLLLLLRIRPAAGMLAFGFWVSIANDSIFVTYGAWFEKAFGVSLVALGFSTIAIGGAELLGETCTALFSDRIGLKRACILGLVGVTLAYLLLPLFGISLGAAMVGMFCIFFCFEFVIVTSFSLSTELMPEARATMMAGFYATAGLGRMLGVLLGGWLWQQGGIVAVTCSAASCTVLGLLSLLWGLAGWRHHS